MRKLQPLTSCEPDGGTSSFGTKCVRESTLSKDEMPILMKFGSMPLHQLLLKVWQPMLRRHGQKMT